MSEPNLPMEAGRLEGFAMAVDADDFDRRKLASELREMAARLVPDRSQARAALHGRDAVVDEAEKAGIWPPRKGEGR